MQPDFWNDKRPAGVPNNLDMGGFRSVVEVFERSCKTHADRPAFSNMGVTLTYADLERYSAAFAGCRTTLTCNPAIASRCRCPTCFNTLLLSSVPCAPG